MTLERANPIPPGYYWVDAPIWPSGDADPVGAFRAWIKASAGKAAIIKDQPLGTYGGDPNAGRWFLFRITEPYQRWGLDAKLGFPTVATSAQIEQEDIVQRPPPEGSIIDKIPTVDEMTASVGEKVSSTISTVAILGALGLGAYLIIKARK